MDRGPLRVSWGCYSWIQRSPDADTDKWQQIDGQKEFYSPSRNLRAGLRMTWQTHVRECHFHGGVWVVCIMYRWVTHECQYLKCPSTPWNCDHCYSLQLLVVLILLLICVFDFKASTVLKPLVLKSNVNGHFVSWLKDHIDNEMIICTERGFTAKTVSVVASEF